VPYRAASPKPRFLALDDGSSAGSSSSVIQQVGTLALSVSRETGVQLAQKVRSRS
jgi:hypothetical protein